MNLQDRDTTLLKLSKQGIVNPGPVHWNLATAALYEHAVRNGEGEIANGGALVCNTGVHTGRSANDKFILQESDSEANIDWGTVNRPISDREFETILARHLAYFQNREIYVQDCWAGADRGHRLGVRIVTEQAWHNLFARNMFIQPTVDELHAFEPQFTVLQAPNLLAPEGTPCGRALTSWSASSTAWC